MEIPLTGDSFTEARLLGVNDENFRTIEARYPVTLSVSNGVVHVSGPDSEPVKIVAELIHELASAAGKGHEIHKIGRAHV